jgi:RNA polymerase sigma-70 factor (ECF subfamily)
LIGRNDEELVRATLAGDLPAFDELMQRYERLVYSLVVSFATNSEEALDLTQEIFLKAYRKLAAFDGRGTLKAWLARIAINEGINSAKSAKRRTARHEAWHVVREDHQPAAQHHDLLIEERKKQVASALEELAPRHRLAIELRYLQEMSIREVASVLECSEGVARNILFRGLRKLRTQLAQAS